MADTPVEIFCHRCGQWFGPSKANDGTRIKCSHCGSGLMVVRYPELHPTSRIGANTRPHNRPVLPNTSLEVSSSRPPAASPRKIIPGRIEDSSHVNPASVAAPMVADIAVMVRESRQRRYAKQEPGAREPGPFDAHIPPANGGNVCEECRDGNYKPRGIFGRAEYEVTLLIAGTPVPKKLCREHAKAHVNGFIPPRPIKVLELIQPPPPRNMVSRLAV